jgi:hypothetical protein
MALKKIIIKQYHTTKAILGAITIQNRLTRQRSSAVVPMRMETSESPMSSDGVL